MAVEFPQDFREAVRSQTEIVALIGEVIALQPRAGGREYVGLCCFHDDRNPSLVVYPGQQTFRCWACNTGGDVFTFVRERENVGFRDALEILARRAGLPIPQRISGRTQDEELKLARVFEVLQWAENIFHKTLLDSDQAEPARRYLYDRGFDDELIREFRLGFHPNDWNFILNQSGGRYSSKLLREARLVGERDDGSHYDYFVNRVLFSIRNERGQPVAFGGRILPGSTDKSKYFNSPESIVFHKSRLLYGIDKAREAIREEDVVLVTEGYTDCIACHQHGVKHTVATLGTALTDAHVTALKRYTRKVVLVFDGDTAGQNAALKAAARFLAQDVDLRILTLPNGADPADFLELNGGDALAKLVDNAPEAWEFSFQAARLRHGIDTIDGRSRILEDMLALLAQVPDMATNVKEGFLIANLAQRLGVSEQSVRDRIKEVRRTQHARPQQVIEEQPEDHEQDVKRLLRGQFSRDDRLECDLLEIMLATPAAVPFVRRALSTDDNGESLEPHEAATVLRNPALRAILEVFLELAAVRDVVNLPMVLDQLSEQRSLTRLVVWIDARAREKRLDEKIHSLGVNPADGCPLLLQQSLANLKWRQEEQSQQHVAIQLSQQSDGPQGLDEATQELLRQAAEFHKQRANRRTGS
ncbi:MAG: DNA primase [Planctomycetaceae bacterium]